MKCVSPFYLVSHSIWVPCGKCNFCLKRKRATWSHRLNQEMRAASSAAFITLTYDPERIVQDVKSRAFTLEKTHVQKFIKRLRKSQGKAKLLSPGKGIRYYTVGEYGDLGRPHYHMLAFNLHSDTLGNISDLWGQGFVHIGKVEPASVAYVCGYVINKEGELDKNVIRQFPFAMMSKGIGKTYLTPQMKRWHKRGQRNYASERGNKVPLARYYKDKIFTTLEKLTMGLKMDRELDERYQTEMQRLSVLQNDPESYYREQERQAYNRVRTTKGIF